MKHIVKNLQGKSLIILALIFFLGFFLRTYKLGDVPIGFHRDEAFFGYNAFSLLQTGRDMTGDILPIHLKSFLYSPAGYSYFAIPFIAIFGLTEFAVRLPSALFGSFTVLLVYFFVKSLFSYCEPKQGEQKYSEFIALVASLFVAISPWHINLSRVATENVLVVFFITLATMLVLQWSKKQKLWPLLGAFFCFSFSLFLYQAPRAFLPLYIPTLFLTLLAFRVKSIKVFATTLIVPVCLFFITIIIPVVLILHSPVLSQRIHMLSIFQQPETQLSLDEQIREDGVAQTSPLFTRLFHNKLTNYSTTFLKTYFNHFSYNFLFTDAGLPDRYRIPEMGLLYLFDLPLLLLGIWWLFLEHKRIAIFLTAWILLAPVGSALTFDDVPNLQRTLLMFPALPIVTAFGFVAFWQMVSRFRFASVLKLVVVGIMLYGFCYYMHQYYIHQIYHRPWYRQEGYKTLITKVNALLPNYQKVVITNWETDPAIFFLFYTRYNPALVQKQLESFPTIHYGDMAFQNYNFSTEECPLHETPKVDPRTGKIGYVLSGKKGVLYANHGTCKIAHNQVTTFAEINRSDGSPVFKIQAMQ